MIHGARPVSPVKAFKYVFALLRRERIAGRFYAQHTFVVSGFLQLYADGTGGGVFNGVVEKYLHTLPEMLRAFSDYRMLVYAVVLIAVMLATNSPFLASRLNAVKARFARKAKNGKEGNAA